MRCVSRSVLMIAVLNLIFTSVSADPAEGLGINERNNDLSCPETLSELETLTGIWWKEESNALLASSYSGDRRGREINLFDLSLLNCLSVEELMKIQTFVISGTTLTSQDLFSFNMMPNLNRVGISDNNLYTIRGLDETKVVHVSLTDIPLSDITPISGLTHAEYIWIRSTEKIERLPDLSKLNNMYRLAIQASPLESLDGIETLQRPVGLVLGMVNDVSALELVDPKNLPIAMVPEHQEAQPEIVAQIKEMGFELYEHFD